jgi:hypothetical protein
MDYTFSHEFIDYRRITFSNFVTNAVFIHTAPYSCHSLKILYNKNMEVEHTLNQENSQDRIYKISCAADKHMPSARRNLIIHQPNGQMIILCFDCNRPKCANLCQPDDSCGSMIYIRIDRIMREIGVTDPLTHVKSISFSQFNQLLELAKEDGARTILNLAEEYGARSTNGNSKENPLEGLVCVKIKSFRWPDNTKDQIILVFCIILIIVGSIYEIHNLIKHRKPMENTSSNATSVK